MLGLGAGIARILWKKSGGNLPFDPYSTGRINISDITVTGVLRSVAYNNTYDPENIEISDITVTGVLRSVAYNNTYDPENIEISDITVTGVLTHIDDL